MLHITEVSGFFGIDFGTTNSYFAHCPLPTEGSLGQLNVRRIEFADKQASLATVVLWNPAEGPGAQVEEIGENAEIIWLASSAAERQACRLGANFKPDIAVSSTARADAKKFLITACQRLRETKQIGALGKQAGVPVVIGVPARIGTDFKKHLSDIAADAELGEVECIAEPLGALAWCLHDGRIDREIAEQGVVVVDFGGGTLDMALVDEKEVREPWGNPIVGGRLFDDLFFQWVLDKNPGVAEQFGLADLQYANRVGARHLKEAFSKAWAAAEKKNAKLEKFIHSLEVQYRVTLGVLNLKHGMVDEFIERARNYRPSTIAAADFAALGGPLATLARADRTDLIALVRDTVLGPKDEGKTAASRAPRVILTGGSSDWPFMKPLVAEALGLPLERIIVPEQPMRAIGEGLALFAAIRYRNRKVMATLIRELPELRKELESIVDKKIETISERLTVEASLQVFGYAKAKFHNWYEEGGSLKEVQADITGMARKLSDQVVGAKRISEEWKSVNQVVVDAVMAWLQRRGAAVKEMQVPTSTPENLPSLPQIALDLGGTLTTVTNIMVTSVVVAVALIAKATLVAALAVNFYNPFVWAIVLMAGVAGYTALQETIQDWVKVYNFGPTTLYALQWLISKDRLEAKLAEAEKAAKAEFQKQLRAAMENSRGAYIRYVEAVRDKALQQLGFLEMLGTLDAAASEPAQSGLTAAMSLPEGLGTPQQPASVTAPGPVRA